MNRRATAPIAILLAAVTVSPALAISPAVEVWVVLESSKEIAKLDDLSPLMASEFIDLDPGGSEPAPYGIAFSTIFQHPGEWAFVTQGHLLKTISYAEPHVIDVHDIAAEIGVLPGDLEMRGVDAARPDDDGSGMLRSYLHVAADVTHPVTLLTEPYFIVLDQEALTPIGAGNPKVVSHGFLFGGSPAGHEAMEVRVLGQPAGPATQRAWYTVRETSIPPKLHVVRVDSGPVLPGPFTPQTPHVTIPMPAGGGLPGSIHPGAPHERELPLVPGAATGLLHHLDLADTCALGAFEPRASTVTGPGLGSYDIWTAALDPLAATGKLIRSNWHDPCDINGSWTVGEDPVDVDTLARVGWFEVYVANRNDDTVSVLVAGNPTPVLQAPVLIAPGGSPCVKCPRSLAVRERPATLCRATNHRMELINGGADLVQTWDEIGCDDDVSFRLWCKCLEPSYDDCDLACVQNCPDFGVDPSGETHCEVVVDGDGDNEATTSSGSNGSSNNSVQTNDDPS